MYFFIALFMYADDKLVLTKKNVNDHWKDIAFWDHGISSKLVEQGYNYAWESICDDDLTTAWVEGVKGN